MSDPDEKVRHRLANMIGSKQPPTRWRQGDSGESKTIDIRTCLNDECPRRVRTHPMPQRKPRTDWSW